MARERSGRAEGGRAFQVFNSVEIKPEMTGHYLAEFSCSYKPVKHGRPGIGATHCEYRPGTCTVHAKADVSLPLSVPFHSPQVNAHIQIRGLLSLCFYLITVLFAVSLMISFRCLHHVHYITKSTMRLCVWLLRTRSLLWHSRPDPSAVV